MGIITLVVIVIGFIVMNGVTQKQPALNRQKWLIMSSYGVQFVASFGLIATICFAVVPYLGTASVVATAVLAIIGMALAVVGMFRTDFCDVPKSFYFTGL